LYELALGPLALAFVGVSDKDSVAEVKKCEAKFGTGWKDEWLRRRGLSLSQYVGQADEKAVEEEKELSQHELVAKRRYGGLAGPQWSG
jgi:hypothetical protein